MITPAPSLSLFAVGVCFLGARHWIKEMNCISQNGSTCLVQFLLSKGLSLAFPVHVAPPQLPATPSVFQERGSCLDGSGEEGAWASGRAEAKA